MTNARIARDRALRRLADIQENIRAIRRLLEGKSLEDVGQDLATRAALERFLEIISEASRHLPDHWKANQPDIPWRQVADLGNLLRHAYRHVELRPLWDVYLDDLDPLERAVDAMLAAHPPMESLP